EAAGPQEVGGASPPRRAGTGVAFFRAQGGVRIADRPVRPGPVGSDGSDRSDRSVRSDRPGADGTLYSVQTGRVPQAMPWALKASQIRQPFGVPFFLLNASSTTERKTVYQLVEPQPSTTAAVLHLPPETRR